jgi:hypothetical protein
MPGILNINQGYQTLSHIQRERNPVIMLATCGEVFDASVMCGAEAEALMRSALSQPFQHMSSEDSEFRESENLDSSVESASSGTLSDKGDTRSTSISEKAVAYVPGPVEVGWQIYVGAAVGVFPFIIGAYEFGKRILIQQRFALYSTDIAGRVNFISKSA